MKLPQRPNEHILEELSNRFFQSRLPENWTITKPANDYGVDFVVSIFDGHNASPYEIHIQLKSSQHVSGGSIEKVPIRISTYNHLSHLLHVVMLIKYIADENEAYWILLVDLPEPNQSNKTFTVSIPRENALSSIDWGNIESYIREVVDYKLTSADVIRNRRKNHTP